MSLREAFFDVCKDAAKAKSCYVSLYSVRPFYGGSEEGGWWGSDIVLEAYQSFDTEEAAEIAKMAVEKLAEQLNIDARRQFGEQCIREMEWLEARGLDADYLPEVAGEDDFFVTIEEVAGELTRRGCRHYD